MHNAFHSLTHNITSAEHGLQVARENCMTAESNLRILTSSLHADLHEQALEQVLALAEKTLYVGGIHTNQEHALRTIENQLHHQGSSFSKTNQHASNELACAILGYVSAKKSYEEAKVILGRAMLNQKEPTLYGRKKSSNDEEKKMNIFSRIIIEESDNYMKARMNTWPAQSRENLVSLGGSFFSWWFGLHHKERPAMTTALLVAHKGIHKGSVVATLLRGKPLNTEAPFAILATAKYPQVATATPIINENQLNELPRVTEKPKRRQGVNLFASTRDVFNPSNLSEKNKGQNTKPPKPPVHDIELNQSRLEKKPGVSPTPTTSLAKKIMQDVVANKGNVLTQKNPNYITMFAKEMGIKNKSQEAMLAKLPISKILTLIPPLHESEKFINRGAFTVFENAKLIAWQKLNKNHVYVAEAIRHTIPNTFSQEVSLEDFFSLFGEKTYETYARMKTECTASPMRIS